MELSQISWCQPGADVFVKVTGSLGTKYRQGKVTRQSEKRVYVQLVDEKKERAFYMPTWGTVLLEWGKTRSGYGSSELVPSTYPEYIKRAGTPSKVTYTIELPIDRESWDLQFGTGTTDKEIADDVKSYLDTVVLEQLRRIDALREED